MDVFLHPYGFVLVESVQSWYAIDQLTEFFQQLQDAQTPQVLGILHLTFVGVLLNRGALLLNQVQLLKDFLLQGIPTFLRFMV